MTGRMAPAPPSDAGLVHSALGGDAASFSALLDRYRASLYARALALLGRPEDAADTVQETFLLALTRLGQARDPEAVGGWLHAVLRSVCAMELRRPARRVTVAEIDSHAPAAQRVRGSYLALAGRDPDPYVAMFAPDAEIAASGLVVQGRDQIRAMCEHDLDHGIGARLVDVVSSAAITVIESRFVNPAVDPQHCPPAVTQVVFHDGTDQVRRSLGYFHPRPAPTRE